ncbi:hypothetical protein JCM10908_003482 [Rhodotorula pacifica]|uniref:uncharacterized protein n=1 Tax=Rhodotorula pacifica TaxID=1495444 RepID=UPI00316D5768
MPVAFAFDVLGSDSGWWTLTKWLTALSLVWGLRTWSRGYVCREQKELAGKTYILTGGFSGVGLSVLQYLAAAGAQVIVLTPEPLSPTVIQLLLLLRSTSENDRLYAEECDLGNVESIRKFVQGWQKDARSGMVQDLEARIDGVILCDEEDETAEKPAIGSRPAAGGENAVSKYGMTRLTGRHALIQLLLPTLLRSAATSTSLLRIINTVSPFYATVTPATFRPDGVEYQLQDEEKAPRYPTSQPWIAQGQIALASILLWREFQTRVKSGAAATKAQPPSTTSGGARSTDLAEATPILPLSVCPGLLRSTVRSLLRASPSSPNFSVLGCAIYLFIFPLVWLFAKSADEGSQVVLAALMADVYKEGQEQKRRVEKTARGPDGTTDGEAGKGAALDEDRPPLLVRPGALYREGLEVRLPILDTLPPTSASQVWESQSKLVEKMLASVLKAEKDAEAESSSAQE